MTRQLGEATRPGGVAAFCEYLRTQSWTVSSEIAWCEVFAERDGALLYAEAKGRTSAPGLDVDTAYGQLLRRMLTEEEPAARYAVVVPTEALRAADRVSRRVHQLLHIDIYAVESGGAVTLV